MPPEALHKLIGQNNVSVFMAALSDLIPQLPTSSGEDTVTNLWSICQYGLVPSFHSEVAVQFFGGLKSIVLSAQSSTKKNVVSPAILRCIQKLITTTFFQDVCQHAAPSLKKYESVADAEKLWIAYAECMSEVSDSTAVSEYEINDNNLFGISTCAVVLKQNLKVLRKVELYISRHEWLDTGLELENHTLRFVLTSLAALGPQYSNASEMKISILSLLDIMLVKGINTMSLEVLAMLVAFWWDSIQTHEHRFDFLDIPLLQVSTRSSLLLTRNLCFQMQAWSLHMIIKFFDLCIADLPPKLAVLCQLWKISDEVSNKASRVLSAAAESNEAGSGRSDVRRKNALKSLKSLVQLLNGGAP
jgi:hypothetical protein